jgi:hypothetical protein
MTADILDLMMDATKIVRIIDMAISIYIKREMAYERSY